MFTGIIETTSEITKLESIETNLDITLKSSLTHELKIDQSIAHNGVCLTVIDIDKSSYKVTAIEETLEKTNLKNLKIGNLLNVERCIKLNDRLDGHVVQGHVDTVGKLIDLQDKNGSYYLTIQYENTDYITVEKGSICVNGISLTVIDSKENSFSVALIPYTWQFTNMNTIKIGDLVNLEFDILGKYIQKIHQKNYKN